jgi:hypothetical protein
LGGHTAQFEHPVTDVAIFGQMGGSSGFTASSHHLVKGMAIAESRVEIPAKFTRPTGSRSIEAAYDGMVDVFHE